MLKFLALILIFSCGKKDKKANNYQPLEYLANNYYATFNDELRVPNVKEGDRVEIKLGAIQSKAYLRKENKVSHAGYLNCGNICPKVKCYFLWGEVKTKETSYDFHKEVFPLRIRGENREEISIEHLSFVEGESDIRVLIEVEKKHINKRNELVFIDYYHENSPLRFGLLKYKHCPIDQKKPFFQIDGHEHRVQYHPWRERLSYKAYIEHYSYQ